MTNTLTREKHTETILDAEKLFGFTFTNSAGEERIFLKINNIIQCAKCYFAQMTYQTSIVDGHAVQNKLKLIEYHNKDCEYYREDKN